MTSLCLSVESSSAGLVILADNERQEPIRKDWSRFGYCRDEFPDNGHFPRELYVRDARRMVSDYIITEATASQNGDPEVSDPVAVAYWPTDTHSVRRILRGGRVQNDGFIFKDGHRWRPFDIAYRALLPRKEEATNLVSVTCPSSSHVGYGEYTSCPFLCSLMNPGWICHPPPFVSPYFPFLFADWACQVL